MVLDMNWRYLMMIDIDNHFCSFSFWEDLLAFYNTSFKTYPDSLSC